LQLPHFLVKIISNLPRNKGAKSRFLDEWTLQQCLEAAG